MISEKMQDQLNKQLNEELYSSYIYLSMSAYCESISMSGFAHWLSVQSQEENVHAMKIYRYLLDQDARVRLQSIKEPQSDFSSLESVVEQTLEHEKFITLCINNLMGLALKENDFATHSFLQWFVGEQIEEESSVRAVLDKVRLVKDSGEGLFLVDRELGQRVVEPAGQES